MNTAKVLCLNLWRRLGSLAKERRGQDMIEYALMAGLIATGIVTMSPGVAVSISTIMSKVNSVMVLAGA